MYIYSDMYNTSEKLLNAVKHFSENIELPSELMVDSSNWFKVRFR